MSSRLIAFTLAAAAVTACGRKQSPRDASVLDYAPLAPSFTAAAPAGLGAAGLAATGPTACDAAGCPTLAEALRPVFAAGATTAAGLVARLDERVGDLARRAVDHFVPCLEESPTQMPVTLGGKAQLTPEYHCFTQYPRPDAPERSVDFEQVAFSRGDLVPAYGVIRLGEVDDNVTTLWTRRDATAGQVDVWRATSRTLANEGKTYLQVRVGPGTGLAISAAGLSQFTGDNQLACGVQVRGNGELLYVKGRFFPVTDVSFARDPAACAAVEAKSFCVKAADLAALAEGDCEAAGLTALELTELTPADLAGDAWGEAVNVDHSDDVGRFRLEGLAIYR